MRYRVVIWADQINDEGKLVPGRHLYPETVYVEASAVDSPRLVVGRAADELKGEWKQAPVHPAR